MSIKLLRTKRLLALLSQKQLISRLLVVMQTLSRLHTEFQECMRIYYKEDMGRPNRDVPANRLHDGACAQAH